MSPPRQGNQKSASRFTRLARFIASQATYGHDRLLRVHRTEPKDNPARLANHVVDGGGSPGLPQRGRNEAIIESGEEAARLPDHRRPSEGEPPASRCRPQSSGRMTRTTAGHILVSGKSW